MNYTTIELSGKKIGLKFGMYANRLFDEKSKKVTLFEGSDLNELGIATLLHAGHLNDAVVKEYQPDATFEQFVDYVEQCAKDNSLQDIVSAVKVWANASLSKEQATVEVAKKKKPTGRKSSPSLSAK